MDADCTQSRRKKRGKKKVKCHKMLHTGVADKPEARSTHICFDGGVYGQYNKAQTFIHDTRWETMYIYIYRRAA